MHWKLTIMGDHCCVTQPDGQIQPGVSTKCLSTPACSKDISQVMLPLDLPDEDGAPHSEAVLPLKIKVIACAGQMQLARLRLTAETGCHLDETKAALVGTEQLGAKAQEAVML